MIPTVGPRLNWSATLLDRRPGRRQALHFSFGVYNWSGKHKAVVRGINLVTLLWTDGDRHVPCDYRLYDKADGLTKNDHFAAMIRAARARGFRPRCVTFDGWYSSLGNLKLVRDCGWVWLTRLKSNRLVNRDRQGARPLKDTAIAAAGTEVWLPGYGRVKVFGIATPDGGTEHWATSDLAMTALERVQFAEFSWAIESYHRGVKQCTGIERCQCRAARAQRNHIGFALRAFLRLESYGFARGVSWVEAKGAIIRDAVRAYLDRPYIRLPRALTAQHLLVSTSPPMGVKKPPLLPVASARISPIAFVVTHLTDPRMRRFDRRGVAGTMSAVNLGRPPGPLR